MMKEVSFIELFEQILYLRRLLEYTQHKNLMQDLPTEIKLNENETILTDFVFNGFVKTKSNNKYGI